MKHIVNEKGEKRRLEKKAASKIMLTLILMSLLTSTFNVPLIESELSESLEMEWNKTYGGTGYDSANSVVQTTDGGYALVGSTYSFGAGEDDIWLVKTDASGNMQWNKTYGGSSRDVGSSVLQTSDNGFILAGSTMSFGAWRIWLIKTDAHGNVQWNKTLRRSGSWVDLVDGERSVIQTSDGGYVVVGATISYDYSSIWLIKTDPNGNMQWSKTYEPYWTAHSIVQTIEGGYAFAGTDVMKGNALLVKTDSTGTMQWYKTYGGGKGEAAHSLVQTADGGYAFSGGTVSFGAGQHDVWLVKTDVNGNMQWSKTYGGAELDYGESLVRTSDGGYAIGCRQSSFGAGQSDFWLVKTDSAGSMQWNLTFGGTNEDYAFSLVLTADGGYALAGFTGSYGVGGADFWLIKLSGPKVLATVDIDPDVLNLRSKGQWITAYIQLPQQYDPEDIDATTILLNGTISPVLDPKCGFVTNSSDYLVDDNNDAILERMVKFDRATVESFITSQGISYGNVALTITGKLFDGTPFEGTDIISVFYGGAGGRRK